MNPTLVAALRAVSVFALALAMVGMMLVPNPLTTPTAVPPIPSRPIPNTDLNPLGANFFLDREVELWKREQTLKMAREAGIGWVKMLFSWDAIELKKGKFWDDHYKKSTWEKFDEIVELSDKYGLRIIARLDRPPDWTRQDNSYKSRPPDNFADFGDFVYAVVSRYKGRIQHYQIWNEPNIWPEWGNQPVDPEGYVRLLSIAYQRAKEAAPDALILSAPLAQTLEENPRNLSELKFLEAMYQAGAKDYFDILFANGYGFEFPPHDPPDPKVLNFGRVQLVRDIMVKSGDAGKAVWLNEYGWNASPEDFPKEKLYWRRVTEQQQADYTIEGIKLARDWGWMGVINVWYFRQVGDISPVDRSDYYFRVVDVDFTPRFVYYKLQELSKTLKVAHPGLHQETSPAIQVRGRWRYIRQDDASHGGAVVGTEPGDILVFTFFGTNVNLVFTGTGDSGMLEVAIDGQQPAGLPRNRFGRAHVDLYGPKEAPQLRGKEATQLKVPLVRGLSYGKHTLILTVSQDKNPASEGRLAMIDALEVEANPVPLVWFYLFLALAALGVVGFAFSWLGRPTK